MVCLIIRPAVKGFGMPIDVEYLRDGTFVRITGRGIVTDDEYRCYVEEIYESDAKTRRYLCALVDWSRVEKVDVSIGAIREGVAMMFRASKLNPRGALVAVVAPQAETYGLTRMWEGFVEETGWRTRVFENAEEAESWLEAQLRWTSRMFAEFSIKLTPADLEARFRLSVLTRDTRVAIGCMLLACLFHVLSFPIDLELLAGSRALYAVWGVRSVSAAIAIVCFLLVRRSSGVAFFDNVVFLWAALLLMGIVLANAMLPVDYTTHVAWDLLLVLAAYAVLPLPLKRQLIVASIITVGDIVLFWQHKVLVWPAARIDMVAAFVCANMIGIFASWEMKRWRRRLFEAVRREADVKAHLADALREIKTLKGIIPICANCKEIRTDEGVWEQVESYVRDHSDAEFSHSICPKCMKTLYPELFDTDG